MNRVVISLMLVTFLAFPAYAATTAKSGSAEILVADFNRGEAPNNLGGAYGPWNSDPNDPEQGCYLVDEADDYKDAKNGYCIRLDYDVQSKKPAFNGFWTKLNNLDVTGYDVLSFWVKGTPDGKFSTAFKVELKDSQGKRAVYSVTGVSKEWKEFAIEFKKTKAPMDWKKLTEFVVTFDDIVSTYKEGTIYLDQVVFKKKSAA